jgi:hypothetical protein
MTEIRGPVFLQTTRWGSLEPRLPEVNGWVTYRLYAHNPELRMSSLMEVVEDVNILAIRNDEVVQDAALVTHYAFKERNGEVKSGAIGYSASAPDFWMGPMDLDLPWVCLYSPEGGHGLASVRLRHDFGHRYGKPATSDKAGTYLNCSQGSISYWFRAYAIELQVQRPLFLEKGAFYSETNAYLPCKMNAEKDSLVRLDERAEALRHSLSASSEVDI